MLLTTVRQAAGLLILLGLIASAIVIFSPAGPPAQPVRAQTSAPTVGDTAVNDGRLLYIQNCAACHGAHGEGSPVAPALTDDGPAALDFYMRTGRMPLARLGTPSQDQTPNLTPAQIAAITVYTSGFSHGPQIPTVVADTSAVGRGWYLYINNCAACHGAAGAGGSVGAGVTAPALSRADALTVAEAMLIGPGAMPRFSFAPHDVNAIAGYVAHLQTEPPAGGVPVSGAGPVPEGLIAAVAGLAVLVVITKWIGRPIERDAETGPREPPT